MVVLRCLYFNLHDELDQVMDDTNDIDSDIVTLSTGRCIYILLGTISLEVQTI